jgi:hypothetical protein
MHMLGLSPSAFIDSYRVAFQHIDVSRWRIAARKAKS